jgi:hypothetical protein
VFVGIGRWSSPLSAISIQKMTISIPRAICLPVAINLMIFSPQPPLMVFPHAHHVVCLL